MQRKTQAATLLRLLKGAIPIFGDLEIVKVKHRQQAHFVCDSLLYLVLPVYLPNVKLACRGQFSDSKDLRQLVIHDGRVTSAA